MLRCAVLIPKCHLFHYSIQLLEDGGCHSLLSCVASRFIVSLDDVEAICLHDAVSNAVSNTASTPLLPQRHTVQYQHKNSGKF